MPPTTTDHAQSSKRAMAADVRTVLRRLGHERFVVVGHDRGSYVALRLALDHPEAVAGLVVLDGIPLGVHVQRCDDRFATAYWHWFFFAQPDKPERAVLTDPDAWYGAGPEVEARMGAENYAEYRAAIHDPATVHAMIEDYRAGLGVDRAHELADRAAGRRVGCPLLVLWSRLDDLEDLHGDPLAIWANWASDLRGGHALDSAHHMAEDAPDELAAALIRFLAQAVPGRAGSG